MKIASANLQMTSTHVAFQQHEVKESMTAWVGQRPAQRQDGEHRHRPETDSVSLSERGRHRQANEAQASNDDHAAVDGDPRVNLIRQIIEIITGRRIQVFDPAALQSADSQAVETNDTNPTPPPDTPKAAGYGVEYDRHESYMESEQTSFSVKGSVTTADGRKISFQLELNMSRQYYEESNVSLRLGDAARKTDPLVLNFSGTAAQLSDQRFAFDLNADGSPEQISRLAAGSGYLAFDRNADGQINNGSELFGPQTGNGFQELSAFDDDHNGWIDENDSSYAKLLVWSPGNGTNGQLRSLAEAGVGAISLTRIDTPFDLKTNDNELLGQIRNSGIFLQENGTTGTIQQIDLTA